MVKLFFWFYKNIIFSYSAYLRTNGFQAIDIKTHATPNVAEYEMKYAKNNKTNFRDTSTVFNHGQYRDNLKPSEPQLRLNLQKTSFFFHYTNIYSAAKETRNFVTLKWITNKICSRNIYYI